jgi:hypothetical protein
MFAGAASFDHPVGAWKVDNVTSMHAMFNGASSYRHPLAEWRIDNVKNMSHMFQGASAFIQPLGSWKLRPGCQTASMFAATNFNNSRPVESEAPAPAPASLVPEAEIANALPDPGGAADAVEAEVAVAHAQIAEARRTGAIDEEAAAVAWAAA